MGTDVVATAGDRSPPGASGVARDGVAFLAFSTQSSYGARVDWELLSLGRTLRRRGIPSVLFQVHYDATDEAENNRRTDELVSRILSGAFAWVVCSEVWTADLGRRLLDAGVRIIERRARSLPESLLDPSLDTLLGPSVGTTRNQTTSRPPLDEYRGLVELLGLPPTDAVTNVDLTMSEACSYKATIDSNPFFAELADDPSFAGHRGCAYCFNGHRMPAEAPPGAPVRDKADRLLDELRSRRAMLPGLKTVWMPFAEAFYDGLLEAFDRSTGDPVWHGLTMSMQCRPDVIVSRRADIELLARKAERAQTVIKIAVVGYENFSPAELQRMNRGVTPADLASAAAILGSWARDPIPGLDVKGYIPSFILFNPWTTLEDLELNLREIQRHGLASANIERMRIGSATPLYEMARRAKLTSSGPVRLAVHPNGYFSETGYSFRDARVAAASDGLDALKSLGFADQAPLLVAIVDAVRRSEDPARIDWKQIAAAWKSIREKSEVVSVDAFRRAEQRPAIDVGKVIELLARNDVTAHAALSRPAPRPAGRRVSGSRDAGRLGLGVGSACNNGCDPCVWTRRLDFRPQAALPVQAPVAGKVVQLAGREPTMVGDLPALVRALREAGAVRVDMDTNGRRLLYPAYVRSLDSAGLDAVTVKLFGVDAASWDAHTREPGSFAQTLEAMATLHHFAPGITLTGMIMPGREPGSRLGELVDFARSIGLSRLRVVVRLAKQDLLTLDAFDATMTSLVAADDGPATTFTVE
jgi:hypothetical protein